MYIDQYGPVLILSYSDMKYIMVLYDLDSNLIQDTAIPYKTKLELDTAYKRLFSLIQRQGLQSQLQHLNNESSNLLK